MSAYKFQIRAKGNYSFNTIAQFYNNPEHDSIFFLSNLIVEHFKFWESKARFPKKSKFGINIDFSNYQFTLHYMENRVKKSKVYEFRYYKEPDTPNLPN